MTARKALEFVREKGVVLISAKGPVPSLVDAIAGEPVKGSWWGHPKGRKIFAVLEAVTDSPDVVVCRLVGGKITLVHRRVWPALVRLAERFPKAQLAQVRQEHAASGKHINKTTAFPTWVPIETMKKGRRLAEREAIEALGPWAGRPIPRKHR